MLTSSRSHLIQSTLSSDDASDWNLLGGCSCIESCDSNGSPTTCKWYGGVSALLKIYTLHQKYHQTLQFTLRKQLFSPNYLIRQIFQLARKLTTGLFVRVSKTEEQLIKQLYAIKDNQASRVISPDAPVHPMEVALLNELPESSDISVGLEDDLEVEAISDDSTSSFQGHIHLLLLQAEEHVSAWNPSADGSSSDNSRVSSSNSSVSDIERGFTGFKSFVVPGLETIQRMIAELEQQKMPFPTLGKHFFLRNGVCVK